MPERIAGDARRCGKIAVLGGTGLIGRHVIEALHARGHDDIVATCHSRPAFELAGVTWRRVDLQQPNAAREALRGAATAILCAGRLSTTAELRRDPIHSVTETLRIGVNALEAAAQERISQVVLLSSCTGFAASSDPNREAAMFHGDPPPAWFGVGWMYRFLEKQLQWYSVHLRCIPNALVLRPTLVYGPFDDFRRESGHFVPAMISQVVAREMPIEVWGDGTQTRNLLHAADVARAVVTGLASTAPYAAYNVAMPQSVSVNQVLRTLIELDGFSDARIVHRPDKSSGAATLEVAADAFVSAFAWQPELSLRAGLAETLAWYRAHRRSAG